MTRVYADLDAILTGIDAYVGAVSVTSSSAARAHEGTTFEASCYTDPFEDPGLELDAIVQEQDGGRLRHR